MIDVTGGLGPANSAVGYAIGAVAQRLQPGDPELIHESFVEALRWGRATASEKAEWDKGGAGRLWLGAKRGAGRPLRYLRSMRGEKRRKRKQQKQELTEGQEAVECAAADLTVAWGEATVRTGGGAEGDGTADSHWRTSLEECLIATGRSGAATGHAHAAQWRYVLIGDASRVPDEETIREWAGQVSRRVAMLWNRDTHLARLIAELDSESGLGLQKALVLSTQEISRSIRRIALSTSALTVIGGGAVALLVLFLDKG